MKSISKGMINFLRTCLAAALIVSALGCFSKHPSYPISWPQTTGSNDIESRIEGSFYCSGEIIESKMGLWDMRHITDFLIGGLNSPGCDYIEIRKVQPNEMEIRFINYSGVEFMKRNYKKNRDYRVKDNWIVLKPCVSWAGEDVVFGRGSVTPHLTIDVEQGLIIRTKNTTAGIIFLVIPIGSSGTDWGRFKRIKSDYNKAIEIDPRDALAYNNRGVAYYFKKEYDKSWEDMKKAKNLGYQVHPEFLEGLRKASGRQN